MVKKMETENGKTEAKKREQIRAIIKLHMAIFSCRQAGYGQKMTQCIANELIEGKDLSDVVKVV